MRRQRALVLAGVQSAVLSLASVAFAQRVVLVRPLAPDPVLTEAFNRLRAELTLHGFEAAVVDLETSDSSPERLTVLAEEQGAFAGISLTRRVGASSANISIADRVTGKTSIRTLALGKEPEAPTLLAVRATDLLRASLREFKANEKPPREVVGVDQGPPPDEVAGFAREELPFRLDARAVLLGVTQAEGRAFGPSLGLSYRLTERLALGVLVVGPTLASTVPRRYGTAVLHRALGLARLSFVAVGAAGLELRPVVLAGVHYLDARGEVEAPLKPESAHVTSVAGGVELDADYHLTSAFVVGASVSALMLEPRPAVAVLEERVPLAEPLVVASAGVGVEF